MIESKAPPHQNVQPLEEGPLVLANQDIADLQALELVRETFNQYESYRSNSFDSKYTDADALYFGVIPQKNWEGTNIPRSSLSSQMVLDHIEATLPELDEAIFGSDPEWFQILAEPGSTPQEARAIKDKLLYDLDKSEIRKEANLAFRNAVCYGTGGAKIFWDEASRSVRTEWVDVKDFYFDPNCQSPDIEKNRSVVCCQPMTLNEIEKLRGTAGMKIPETAVLVWMAQNKLSRLADMTKDSSNYFQGTSSREAQDFNPMPSEKNIEVLMYYDKTRIIWVLGREWVMYNEKNPYGFVPFVFYPNITVPGRFPGLSFPEMLKNPQRYKDALYNAHLDELTLALIPPRVSQQGSNMSPEAERWRPGANFQQSDPKAFQVLSPSGATTNVFTDIDFIDREAERRTGVTSLGMGVPRPGNINRTVSGVQAALAGPAGRTRYMVRQIEDYFLTPLLNKAYKLLQYHLKPGETVEYLGPNQQYLSVGTEVFRAPVRFKMLAASKMVAREALASQFGFITQYLFNGPVLGELNKRGFTVDFGEWVQMLKDSTGTERSYNLIRLQNEQERQAASQPTPESQAQEAAAQRSEQTRLQMGQLAAQTDLQVAQIKAQTDLQKEAMQAEREDQNTAREMARLLLEREKDAAKQKAEAARYRTQIEGERAKQQLSQQGMLQKLFFDRQTQAQKLEMQREAARLKAQLDQQNALLTMGSQQNELRFNEQKRRLQLRQAVTAPTRYNKTRGGKESK